MQKYFNNYAGATGIAIKGAEVIVTKADGSPAAIFSDNGVTPITSLLTGADGEFAFYAVNGTYTLTLRKRGLKDEVVAGVQLYDPMDDGAATLGYQPAGDLAVPRTVQDKLRESVSATDFGTLGALDDTLVLQLAIDAVAAIGGGRVLIPIAGDILVSGLILRDFVTIEGLGKNVTRIKLKNGANAHVIQAGSFDANADGTNKATPIGCKTGGLKNLTIDGNKANQTASKHGLAYYGIDLQLEAVEFRNAKGIGLYTESPGGTFSAVVGQNLQSSIRHIECHDNDLGNLFYNGQSDSVLQDVMCYSAGNGAGQYNARFGSKAAGAKVFGMHCWGASDYAVISEAGLIEFTGCHAESAAVAKVWAKQPIIWNGGRIYEVGANTSAVGFKLDRDYNQIRSVTATNINGGLIDTTAGGVAGQNSIIEIFGFTATAGVPLYAGLIGTTTQTSLRLFGSTVASLLQNAVRISMPGGIDMNSGGIDRVNYFAGQGWVNVTISAGNLPVASSYIVIGPVAAVDVTDITSAAGEQGILQVTIRNGGAGAATFKQNNSKLRNNGQADKVLNQHESITYTRITGTVWQQTGGK